ncbi:MAG: two-component regulator propeller domain-containing protein, partial [Cyclobacteriaceae bacterium]
MTVTLPINRLTAQNQTFLHYTSRDGLPSGFIYQIMEDSNGFIWICTDAGLSKFDGYHFTNYVNDPDDTLSISGRVVRTIRELPGQGFLAGTFGGLDLFDPLYGSFHKINLLNTTHQINLVFDFQIVEEGDLWIADRNGLYYIPGQDFTERISNAEFFPADSIQGQPEIYYSIENDGDRYLWIGSNTYLRKFDKKLRKFDQLGPYDQEVESILKGVIWDLKKTSNGDLLITSTTGLAIWRNGRSKPEAISKLGPYTTKQLASTGFQSVTEDSQGRIWLGTGTLGAIRWDRINDEVIIFRSDQDNENSINSDDVHYAFEDSRKNIWFGYHRRGISLGYSNPWEYEYVLPNEQAGPGDASNRVYSMVEDNKDNLWYTTTDKLVMQPVNGEPESYDLPEPGSRLDDSQFDNLFLVHFGNYVLVAENNSNILILRFFDLIKKSFTQTFSFENVAITPQDPEETKTHLYLTTFNAQLISLDKQSLESTLIKLPKNESIDAEFKPVVIGNINDKELFTEVVYFKDNIVHVDGFGFNTDSLSFTEMDINFDFSGMRTAPFTSRLENGVIWYLLSNGILKQNYLTNDYEILFQNESAVLLESSSLIMEDNNGFLWLNNQTGIMRLDPVKGEITHFEMKTEHHPDRLFFNRQLRNGDIVFAQDGYIRFDPDNLKNQPSVQRLYVTEVVSGQSRFNTLYEPGKIEIDHSGNNVAFSFIGLNFRDPVYTRYRYRIDGYDQDWNQIGTQRRVFLANLPPGKYRFDIQAAPRFGSFSDTTASVNFTILPPWWRTYTAYLVYFFILVGGVFTFDRVQRKRLVAKERERTREKELAQAREIEKAYTELKLTQSQLIQSEKMASLGELTAGIAHEIQNPLNFVNNFSDLNSELLEEMIAEIKKGNAKEAMEIADDITTNEKKIWHHGKRAESIVKNMLQHSRGDAGQKIKTDINAMVEEYVNLAFHGMRARDKSFNADYKIDTDKKVPVLNVIPQDIGRVLLNLVNNAFYAVYDQRQKSDDRDYKPLVHVSTKLKEGDVVIRIRDNGPGIPDSLKDKIFQPFFTTKPTGQGTGLGLSLSYDIVKAHGGELKVETRENEGSEFILQ